MLSQTYGLALRQAGYGVACAYAAQDAIQSADDQKPNLVVLELQLADHDGLEFLYEFRSYAEWQQIPAIVLSNLPPPALAAIEKVLYQDLGVKRCLYKPRTTLDQLIKAIAEQVAS